MALNEAQVNYPEDISVVGFDNLMLSNVLKTKLTVVAQPMESYGKKGVQILMQRINEKKENNGRLDRDGHISLVLNVGLLNGGSVKRIRY